MVNLAFNSPIYVSKSYCCIIIIHLLIHTSKPFLRKTMNVLAIISLPQPLIPPTKKTASYSHLHTDLLFLAGFPSWPISHLLPSPCLSFPCLSRTKPISSSYLVKHFPLKIKWYSIKSNLLCLSNATIFHHVYLFFCSSVNEIVSLILIHFF